MPPEVFRLQLQISGAVQGVGFRPFVYRLARELCLRGFVQNTSQGLNVQVEGALSSLKEFRRRVQEEAPAPARIAGLEVRYLDPVGLEEFAIRPSTEGERRAHILPDIATCRDCRRELFDPADRRYRYPFINCTHCGPRFSIILRLPYDRPNTTMAGFEMCPNCRAEYEDPADRRFHAQPNACAACGPKVSTWDEQGRTLAQGEEALQQAVSFLREGKIVAVKGIGGFQLMVAAADREAVLRLRRRKRREEKPFALMAPNLAQVGRVCRVSEDERRLLSAPESPIVLLQKSEGAEEYLAASVAPGNPYLGIMLPYSPLHHLLLNDLADFVVATSANLSDEPICTDNHEALDRLHGIADLFLVHDRPIQRHVDDSVASIVLDRELLLRRARGYAPLPLPVPGDGPAVLALGPHLKNTVALALRHDVFIGQHIGDLNTMPARQAHRRTADDLIALYGASPAIVACDAHPDYASTREAERRCPQPVRVQHHLAHVLACMAENELEPPVLGVAWDGTGFGTDGMVWGGEFLEITREGWRRAGHFRPFPLLGGERAIQDPTRCALGLLAELYGAPPSQVAFRLGGHTPGASELHVLDRIWSTGLNSPRTTSAGRLFDAVAALLDLADGNRFEGQAAMSVEFAAASQPDEGPGYPWRVETNTAGGFLIDWAPLFLALLEDRDLGVAPSVCVAKFHRCLCDVIRSAAQLVKPPRIVLSGGCFQNRRLLQGSVQRLRYAGFQVYWHQRVPPNDGGVALGQVMAARMNMKLY